MPANFDRSISAVATRPWVRSPKPDWAARYLPFTTGALHDDGAGGDPLAMSNFPWMVSTTISHQD
jgi:hypothetical protein